MTIALLADHAEWLPTIADWYRRQWQPYYGTDGPGDAHADLASRCNRDALPVGLVALQHDQLQGVAALDLDPATDLSPSVVGLLVAEAHRGQGVAAALLEAAIRLAEQLGHRRIYVSTNVLGEHLQKTGWRLHGETEFVNDEQGSVYVFELPASRS